MKLALIGQSKEVAWEEVGSRERHLSVITAKTGESELKSWGALFGLTDPCSRPGISLM